MNASTQEVQPKPDVMGQVIDKVSEIARNVGRYLGPVAIAAAANLAIVGGGAIDAAPAAADQAHEGKRGNDRGNDDSRPDKAPEHEDREEREQREDRERDDREDREKRERDDREGRGQDGDDKDKADRDDDKDGDDDHDGKDEDDSDKPKDKDDKDKADRDDDKDGDDECEDDDKGECGGKDEDNDEDPKDPPRATPTPTPTPVQPQASPVVEVVTPKEANVPVKSVVFRDVSSPIVREEPSIAELLIPPVVSASNQTPEQPQPRIETKLPVTGINSGELGGAGMAILGIGTALLVAANSRRNLAPARVTTVSSKG